MGFEFFTDKDYSRLELHLCDKSYMEGYAPSQADFVVFKTIPESPDVETYPNCARWWTHIKSWENENTGTLIATGTSTPEENNRLSRITSAVKEIIECLGEDPEREGLQKTPERYAKALLWMTKGYTENLTELVGTGIFQENHDEMVIVKDIEIYSLCEHHLVPFTGKVSIGYIPNKNVIGLSKLARITEFFARRLQVQERLTKQIALTINQVINPLGVAVVIECTHMCMTMRGVQKPGSITVTSSMLGCFRSKDSTRAEFLNLIKR